MPTEFLRARSKLWKTRDRSSSTIFGVRCRRRLRWCRELRWASIFSARGAAEAPAATIRANSKKKSYLFELNNRDSILDGDRHSCLSLFIFVHCERRRSRVLPFHKVLQRIQPPPSTRSPS